jgi:hypothetical protein
LAAGVEEGHGDAPGAQVDPPSPPSLPPASPPSLPPASPPSIPPLSPPSIPPSPTEALPLPQAAKKPVVASASRTRISRQVPYRLSSGERRTPLARPALPQAGNAGVRIEHDFLSRHHADPLECREGRVAMTIGRRDILKIVAAGAALGVKKARGEEASGEPIRRDVCILGGGSSGTYTAVRLRDLGKSVVVVEKKNRLGGHTETFHDPATGFTADIGVIVWHELPIVRNYFGRFGVPLFNQKFNVPTPIDFVDYRSGHKVPGYTPPTPASLATYFGLLLQFPYLEAGFNLPDPVPPLLLMPFGAFVQQFGLADMVQTAFQFGQGLGDILSLPTIYVMKNFGLGVLQNFFADSFLTTSHFNNSELYEKASAFLGSDVLLSSSVQEVDREAPGLVRLQVETPDGERTIHCKKLVVTCPPVLRNFDAFDLDDREEALFGRFRPNYYWTAAARLTGIPNGLSVQNTAGNTPYNLPPLPGIYSVYPTGLPGLLNVKYGSATPLSDDRVRANMLADIQRLATAGTYPVVLDPNQPLAVFSSHSPFELTVSAEEIAAGFYRELAGLQGRKNTFYNGAAFHTHDSSLLWQFTETLLPQIAA